MKQTLVCEQLFPFGRLERHAKQGMQPSFSNPGNDMDGYKMNARDETVTPNRYGVDGQGSIILCEYAEDMLRK